MPIPQHFLFERERFAEQPLSFGKLALFPKGVTEIVQINTVFWMFASLRRLSHGESFSKDFLGLAVLALVQEKTRKFHESEAFCRRRFCTSSTISKIGLGCI